MTSRSPIRTPRAVITHARRTPIGKYLGGFADLSAAELGEAVVSALLADADFDAARLDEVIMGNGRQAGGGPNVARQISYRSGVPDSVPAWTMNMACGSGLKGINLAAESIAAGRNRALLIGGTESMSGLPFFLPKMRRGYRLGHGKVVDAMYKDGFVCPLTDMVMGETAEKLASQLEITRAEQDAFALSSQQKCAAAVAAGNFADELVPVTVKTRKGEVVVDADEHPRGDAKLESLAKLPAVFGGENGTVTAGNSSGITDGAAAVLVMEESLAEELGYQPLAWVGAATQSGVDPTIMGIGPVPAVNALEERNGLSSKSYDLIELNEAFAAQVLACDRELSLPMERVNVNGGAIALGHPIGATGTRIVVTLLHELARREAEHGLATLCISGGMGMATAFHRSGPFEPA
ncbi:MAG: acetyl-CoA C-acyltransferase [Planctomycetota bacterium]|jgi:acetyl-CoA C-acetyltransferase|nr:acetyl-CoA C-acyltransferase [Planctomycetota bacterium]MDP6519888.1 acetyl-CoA C-acyltransferase [Planctomycetota bacterium]MDP6955315.1 acetyl-CoA C-acyltransferase [Planctomycetota bacterium]